VRFVAEAHETVRSFARACVAPSADCNTECPSDIPRLMELGQPCYLIPMVMARCEENEMFEGFIFDVEGTLVDSVAQNLRSLQDALEKSGHRITIQTLRLYSGLDGDQALQLAVPKASGPEPSKKPSRPDWLRSA
jgi:hypothetical protein